jgi:hypothetical protein
MVCGLTCGKNGFTYTLLTTKSAFDSELEAPLSMAGNRPEALAWLADEAQRLFETNQVSDVRIQAAQSGKYGASRERIETEACVQIAAHRIGAEVRTLNKEQVRAAYGVARGKGAYESLLGRDDVKERSNAARRHQYLLVKAPPE